jgi:2-C-methyl-D-erythritol 2,4-cyclodiphosphate synthase
MRLREPEMPLDPEIERELAAALSAPVSVKATTNEGMGWIGRGEGIACIAVALIETSEPGRVPPALVSE